MAESESVWKKSTACAVPQMGPLTTSGEERQGYQPLQSPTPFGRKSQRELFRKWDHWRPHVRRGKVLTTAESESVWKEKQRKAKGCGGCHQVALAVAKDKRYELRRRRQVALAVVKDKRYALRRKITA